VRKLRTACALPDRPDVGRRCLKTIVHLKPPCLRNGDARKIQPDPGGVRHPACGHQNVAAGQFALTFSRLDHQTDRLSGAPLHIGDLCREDDVDTFRGKQPLQLLSDIRIFVGEQLGRALQDGHLAAKPPIGLRKLKANVTAANHNQVSRQTIQFKDLDMRHRRGLVQALDRRNGGLCAEIQEDAIGRDRPLTAVVQLNRKRLLPCEPGLTHRQLGPGRLVFVHMDRNQGRHHLPLSLPNAFHIDGDGAGQRAELPCMPRKLGNLRAPYLVLGRQAVDIRTGPADPPSFDHHRLFNRLRQVPSEVFSTLTATDNHIPTVLSAHGTPLSDASLPLVQAGYSPGRCLSLRSFDTHKSAF
jgi:hypothetical protein